MCDLRSGEAGGLAGPGLREEALGDGVIVLICSNERCRYYEVARVVHRPQIEPGVYLKEAYVCACGHDLWALAQR